LTSFLNSRVPPQISITRPRSFLWRPFQRDGFLIMVEAAAAMEF